MLPMPREEEGCHGQGRISGHGREVRAPERFRHGRVVPPPAAPGGGPWQSNKLKVEEEGW
eukprot:5972796-Pyramimonas_sp.AAC.2